MKRRDQKELKKLIGVYKQCINAADNVTFQKTEKHFRKLTQNRITKVSAKIAA